MRRTVAPRGKALGMVYWIVFDGAPDSVLDSVPHSMLGKVPYNLMLNILPYSMLHSLFIRSVLDKHTLLHILN